MKRKVLKDLFRLILLVGTVVSLFFVPWLLVWAWILPLPDSVQEQLDEAVEHGLDGIIVYIDRTGEPPETYASGWHDRDAKIPASPDALFKIASISKLYDAVAVTKLSGEGRLALDKTLADYLPSLVGRIEYVDQITLRMMVQHRSGIPNLTDTPNFWASPPASSEEALSLVLDLPAKFKPDEDYEYSNTNYLLIAQIIESVLGYSRFQYIQEVILTPLELENTYGSILDVDAEKVMSGYHVGHPHDLKMDDHGIVATAADVGVFLRALNDGSLFSTKEKKLYSSLYVYKHTGWVPGYQSFAEYHPEIDTVLIQFNNTTDSKLYVWNLAEIVYGRIVKILGR